MPDKKVPGQSTWVSPLISLIFMQIYIKIWETDGQMTLICAIGSKKCNKAMPVCIRSNYIEKMQIQILICYTKWNQCLNSNVGHERKAECSLEASYSFQIVVGKFFRHWNWIVVHGLHYATHDLPPDAIFCDHASDLQYKSSHVELGTCGSTFRVGQNGIGKNTL